MLASGSFIPTLECDEMTLNMLESSTNFGFGALRFREERQVAFEYQDDYHYNPFSFYHKAPGDYEIKVAG